MRFDQCVRYGCGLGQVLFLSVGVGGDLCSFVRENDSFVGKAHLTQPSLPGAAQRDQGGAAVLQMLGALWECGLFEPKPSAVVPNSEDRVSPAHLRSARDVVPA
jgi:hypothetical protein